MVKKIVTPVAAAAATSNKKLHEQLGAQHKELHSNERVREQLRSQHATFIDAEDMYTKASSKRKLAAWVLGIAASAGVGYVLGALVDGAVAMALMYTGSAFLAMMIWIIGLVLTVYAGFNAFSSTFGYIVSDDCARHIDMAQRKVNNAVASIGSLFRSSKPIAA